MNIEGIKRAVRLADRLYQVYPAGGPLHCLLDDGNLADWFCLLPQADWYRPTKRQLRKDRQCAGAWRALTEEERGFARWILHGVHMSTSELEGINHLSLPLWQAKYRSHLDWEERNPVTIIETIG